MKGSEKQVKWAEDIKNMMFEQVAAMRRDRSKFDKIEGPDNNLYPYTTACIDAMESELKVLWTQDQMNDAAFIIDHRSTLSNLVLKTADDWMRTHK